MSSHRKQVAALRKGIREESEAWNVPSMANALRLIDSELLVTGYATHRRNVLSTLSGPPTQEGEVADLDATQDRIEQRSVLRAERLARAVNSIAEASSALFRPPPGGVSLHEQRLDAVRSALAAEMTELEAEIAALRSVIAQVATAVPGPMSRTRRTVRRVLDSLTEPIRIEVEP